MIEFYRKLKTFTICDGSRCCAFDCYHHIKVVDPVTMKITGYRCGASVDNGNMQPGLQCPCRDVDEIMVTMNMTTGKSGGA